MVAEGNIDSSRDGDASDQGFDSTREDCICDPIADVGCSSIPLCSERDGSWDPWVTFDLA